MANMREKMVENGNNEAAIYAEEGFIADVQFAIHNLLEAKQKSRADLARAMGVSDARISQLFSDNPRNLTLRTIARVFHALEEEPELTSLALGRLIPTALERQRRTKLMTMFKKLKAKESLNEALVKDAKSAQVKFKLEANDNEGEIDLLAA